MKPNTGSGKSTNMQCWWCLSTSLSSYELAVCRGQVAHYPLLYLHVILHILICDDQLSLSFGGHHHHITTSRVQHVGHYRLMPVGVQSPSSPVQQDGGIGLQLKRYDKSLRCPVFHQRGQYLRDHVHAELKGRRKPVYFHSLQGCGYSARVAALWSFKTTTNCACILAITYFLTHLKGSIGRLDFVFRHLRCWDIEIRHRCSQVKHGFGSWVQNTELWTICEIRTTTCA